MGDMTWLEIERATQSNALVLLPVGVVEEHGPHMTCGADINEAYHCCKLIKGRLEEKDVSAILAPPLYWGTNVKTCKFPGALKVRETTMEALLSDILSDLKQWGFNSTSDAVGHA